MRNFDWFLAAGLVLASVLFAGAVLADSGTGISCEPPIHMHEGRTGADGIRVSDPGKMA